MALSKFSIEVIRLLCKYNVVNVLSDSRHFWKINFYFKQTMLDYKRLRYLSNIYRESTNA